MYFLLLFKMIFVHCLADYPLQGDFLSMAKNHKKPIPGVPWYQALGAHSAIQSGGVWLITGSLLCATLEFIAHALIDYLKCDGKISFNEDQAAHIVCKVLYCALIAAGVA